HNKIYRYLRIQMRVMPGALYRVAKDSQIVAGLCLTPLEQGHWLTGLLDAPDYRGRGLAQHLIRQALYSAQAPVWLICHPRLAGFYAQMGFEQTTELPQPLADRLRRYGEHKPLIALAAQPTGTT